MSLLECNACGNRETEDVMAAMCRECGGRLNFRVSLSEVDLSPRDFDGRKKDSVWTFEELLPHEKADTVTLGEGWTPILRASLRGEDVSTGNVYFKVEYGNPTGSFKDRGSAVGVSVAKGVGEERTVTVSTGNMAASMSAYSRRAGITPLAILPSDAPQEKVKQVSGFGAEVWLVDEEYGELKKHSHELAEGFGGVSVDSDTPLRVEGQKTSSYETFLQLNRVPDWFFVPSGTGGNIWAQYKAWREMSEMGWVDRLPRMVCCQAENVSPIVHAFELGEDDVQFYKEGETIAHSISNSDPPAGEEALKAVRETGGTAVAVSEDQIRESQKALSVGDGVLVEPASACAYAALRQLEEEKFIGEDDYVVCLLTGSGLKDLKNLPSGEVKRASSLEELEDHFTS